MRQAVHHILLVILLLLTADSASAQFTMRDVFKTMPDSIVPYLSENNRLDLIDFIDSNMKAEVTNLLGGKSVLLQLTDNYLSLSLNEASTLDLRLLPLSVGAAQVAGGGSQVLCMVRTFGSDVRVSTVSFFTTSWTLLPSASYVSLPAEPVTAVLHADEAVLTLKPECSLDYPANEEQESITKPSTNLKFDGRRFKLY